MPKPGYKAVSFPAELWDRVAKYVEIAGEGFRSPTEFIVQAVRRDLERRSKR